MSLALRPNSSQADGTDPTVLENGRRVPLTTPEAPDVDTPTRFAMSSIVINASPPPTSRSAVAFGRRIGVKPAAAASSLSGTISSSKRLRKCFDQGCSGDDCVVEGIGAE